MHYWLGYKLDLSNEITNTYSLNQQTYFFVFTEVLALVLKFLFTDPCKNLTKAIKNSFYFLQKNAQFSLVLHEELVPGPSSNIKIFLTSVESWALLSPLLISAAEKDACGGGTRKQREDIIVASHLSCNLFSSSSLIIHPSNYPFIHQYLSIYPSVSDSTQHRVVAQ